MKHACKRAAKLTSDGFERKLSLLEQTQLKLHLAMCDLCRNYHQSLKTMKDVFIYIRHRDFQTGEQLSEKSKQSICYQLKKEQMKDSLARQKLAKKKIPH